MTLAGSEGEVGATALADHKHHRRGIVQRPRPAPTEVRTGTSVRKQRLWHATFDLQRWLLLHTACRLLWLPVCGVGRSFGLVGRGSWPRPRASSHSDHASRWVDPGPLGRWVRATCEAGDPSAKCLPKPVAGVRFRNARHYYPSVLFIATNHCHDGYVLLSDGAVWGATPRREQALTLSV